MPTMRTHEHHATVTGPGFNLWIILLDGACVRAPTELRWCVGKTRDELRAEFSRRGYAAGRPRKVELGQMIGLSGSEAAN